MDPERGILGQSWQLNVALQGALDHQGMILDFGEVKRRIKQWVDDTYDHRLIVPKDYPGCRYKRDNGRIELEFRLQSGGRISYGGPKEGISLIDSALIDPEILATAIRCSLRSKLPGNVHRLDIELEDESISGASYRYSHGLRQHRGNCQRIAHGHRSRIKIYRDGERCEALELEWARRWRDIYIGNRADLQREFKQQGIDYAQFGYKADQGLYELTLPRESCYLVDFDSTVENLAEHIAGRLQLEHPGSDFRVFAFEGIDKGAIGISGEKTRA